MIKGLVLGYLFAMIGLFVGADFALSHPPAPKPLPRNHAACGLSGLYRVGRTACIGSMVGGVSGLILGIGTSDSFRHRRGR